MRGVREDEEGKNGEKEEFFHGVRVFHKGG